MKIKFYLLLIILLNISCHSADEQPQSNDGYQILNGQIFYNGKEITLSGVNALHSFGLEDMNLLKSWQVKIVREFIGNLREQPINGSAIQDAKGDWLHPLEQIVVNNREIGMVTVLCPFGWVNEKGEQTLFTGLNPKEQSYYQEYIEKMKAIATHFAGQDDVWIELWNEPFHWNNANGYSHKLWKNSMQDLIKNLRSVDGFDNILVVPGNEQGQSEDAILAEGQTLLNQYQNIIFDLHAYEKWLNNQSEAEILDRFQVLKERQIPFFIGEIGVRNVGELMNPDVFLQVAKDLNISTLAWLWKRQAEDQSALLNENGKPNNQNNNNWGSTFKAFLTN